MLRIGIGLPAAVPGADAAAIGDWAAESERRGFHSLSVIDRLVYDNQDPWWHCPLRRPVPNASSC